MPEPFDPYLHWLGIRDPQRPPNYYRLLGVDLFEGDPDVLTSAADRQMSHVRTFQTGRHSAESQRLLNELAAAKLCLLNPQKKAQYDAELATRLQAAHAAQTPAAPSPAIVPPTVGPPPLFGALGSFGPPLVRAVPTPPELPAEFSPEPLSLASAPAAKLRRLRKSSYFVVIPLLIAAIAVLVISIVLMWRRDRSEEPAAAMVGLAQPGTPVEPATATTSGGTSGSSTGAGGVAPTAAGKTSEAAAGASAKSLPEAAAPMKTKPAPEPPLSGASAAPPPVESKTPRPIEKLPASSAEAIAAAREAMSGRDPDSARRYLDLAEQLGSPKDRARIDRLRELLVPLSAFWRAVRRGMDELQPGDELAFGQQPVTVESRASDSVTFSDGQRNTRYSLATLPPEAALAIAERELPPDLPTSALPKAAFLIFDPQGDRELARQLCSDARAEGLPVDALAAELDEQAQPAGAAAGTSGALQAQAAPRLPVPDDAAVGEARRKVHEVFKEGYSRAQKPAEKEALARELLKQGIETTDNPAVRYVLLVEARDLAVQAGAASLVAEAVERAAEHYQVDSRAEMMETLRSAAERPLPSAVRRDLAAAAIDQAEKAIRDDDYRSADVLARIANSLARKGEDPLAAKNSKQLIAEIPRLQREHAASLEAAKALAANADDPQAHLALGKYECFVRRQPQWEKGLAHLAQGGDPALKAVAEAERAVGASTAAAEKVRLADRWRELAGSLAGEFQDRALSRAAFWYKQALPELTGFTRTRVEKLLDEIEASRSDRRRP